MKAPILFADYFDGGGPNAPFYERMIRVLEYTARKHCPDWSVETQRLDPAEGYGASAIHSHVSNTHKLDYWNRRVQAADDGDRILLIDGDMMILRSIDDIWQKDFDLCYTTKRSPKLPFNGGVLFLRVSPAVKRFMAAYWERNIEFLRDQAMHVRFRSKFGGMNQAAFGSLLHEIKPNFGLNLVEVPCAEWNCEQSAWPTFNPNVTRIVHIKSALRKAIFGRISGYDGFLEPLIQIWRGLEREANET